MPKPAPSCELAWSSLGAIIWYLQRCQLDEELLSMRNFERYRPVDETGGAEGSGGESGGGGAAMQQASGCTVSSTVGSGSSQEKMERKHMVRGR